LPTGTNVTPEIRQNVLLLFELREHSLKRCWFSLATSVDSRGRGVYRVDRTTICI